MPEDEAGVWGPQLDPVSAQLKARSGLAGAVFAGAVAGALGVAAWVLLTWQTGSIFVVMALGIGYLVGMAVRVFGGSSKPIFGLTAALLTLVASVFGLVLSAAAIIARQEELPFQEVVGSLDPAIVIQVLEQVTSPITIIILLFAVYESFRVAVVSIPRSAERPADIEGESLPRQEERPGKEY